MKTSDIIARLVIIKDWVAHHAVIIFVVCVGLVFGFLTLRIASYSNEEPSDDQIEERLSTAQALRLNNEAIQKIQELQDRNISLESLFDNGRDNPFE